MSAQDDYIIVTNSQNMGDDAVAQTNITDVNDKNEEVATLALKKRGIILDDQKKERPATLESPDTFYQDLKDIGGIEILSSEEGNEDY